MKTNSTINIPALICAMCFLMLTFSTNIYAQSCSACRGQGTIKKSIVVAGYGIDTSDKFCNTCNTWMKNGSRHAHITCSSCGGTGRSNTSSSSSSSSSRNNSSSGVYTNLTADEQQLLSGLIRQLVQGKYVWQPCSFCSGSGLCKNCQGAIGNTNCFICFGVGTCRWCQSCGGKGIYVQWPAAEKAELEAKRDALMRKAFGLSNSSGNNRQSSNGSSSSNTSPSIEYYDYDGGTFKKNGKSWEEYRNGNKWSSYTEYQEDVYFYYIQNSSCKVAVPKPSETNKQIYLDNNGQWKVVYQNCRRR